ncbi:MAG: DUF1772 domain-containing protein [Acidobacteria bacterium]|nr:MAG: DUF1772 domain-containing protein [Acidobacteriota bacterium]REJ98080.1 MAG: DUF1772 domain-containing protein [Acidobacteriota bacterium]REK16823.1 MAG: DUF1772 domain-containing protein [Acidobacteriota bacterium]REK42734.1 MAG: DUF1772 domain-containing protein [Acidobacteriota bacterium]
MELIDLLLPAAALLCTLVAGFLFAFAIVVMPGIGALGDLEFLRSFKAMDLVIQNNHPVFIIVWVGSAFAAIAAGVLSVWQMEGIERILVVAASAVYILGVQVPTAVVNVPLNNRLQALDLEKLSEKELAEERARFEIPWLRWNWLRTVIATLVSAAHIVAALLE